PNTDRLRERHRRTRAFRAGGADGRNGSTGSNGSRTAATNTWPARIVAVLARIGLTTRWIDSWSVDSGQLPVAKTLEAQAGLGQPQSDAKTFASQAEPGRPRSEQLATDN